MWVDHGLSRSGSRVSRSEFLEDERRVQRIDRLLAMGQREARVIASLATKMRLTQQSRYQSTVGAYRNQSRWAERRPMEGGSVTKARAAAQAGDAGGE